MTQTAEQQTQRLMDYFPVQMKVSGQKIIFCGGQEAVLAKVRLLAKTSAELAVFAPHFCDGLLRLSDNPRLTLIDRPLSAADFADAVLCYIGVETAAELYQVKALAAKRNVPVCVIDNKPECDFLTPAIIDHAPVTVAIGSEGYAPVLVRKLKALCEEQIPAHTSWLALQAPGLRHIARLVPEGYRRRAFWSRLFAQIGPEVLATTAKHQASSRLTAAARGLAHDLAHNLAHNLAHDLAGDVFGGIISGSDKHPHVDFISAGPELWFTCPIQYS